MDEIDSVEIPKPIPIYSTSFSVNHEGPMLESIHQHEVPNLETFHTAEKNEKLNCSVCNEPGDGCHFGAEACRACAAFFRRTVSLNKTYVCRADGNCQVSENIRCMCRACRFEKCIEVGMNPAGVQQRRDTLGKRQFESPPNNNGNQTYLKSSNEETISEAAKTSTFFNKYMPILEKMKSNYAKMDLARLVIHRKEGQSLYEKRAPKSLTYKEASEVTRKEVSIVADWISWCFDDLASLPIDQKILLFQNFYVGFTLMETSYLSYLNNRRDVQILPSGDYIDVLNLDKFFHDPNETEQLMSTEDIKKMFRPSFENQLRNIFDPMMSEKIDTYEFFALCVMIFWDFGLTGQTEECVEVGKEVRRKVMKELSDYYKNFKQSEDPVIRVGNIFSMLPAVQRAVRRIQDDISLSHIFKVYTPPDDFCDIIGGKFC